MASLTRADSTLITWESIKAGSVSRLLSSRLEEVNSLRDYNPVGDGVADDSAAILAARSNGAVTVPTGLYKYTGNMDTLNALFKGEGTLVDGYGKRGRVFGSVSQPPSSIGNESSILTAFSGDNSLSPYQTEFRVTGENTLGKPTTGYVYQPETMPHYTYLYNTSGWNQLLDANGGRTGIAAYRAKVDQYGQGDAVAFNASVFIAATKQGSTDFLANPAGVIINGDMGAGADGVYFNPLEFIMHDNGYDVAAVGGVFNFSRSNPGGKKSCIWHGARFQSVGSAACDAVITGSGLWKSGFDMTTTDFGTNQAAISLKANQRIYLNNASLGSGNTLAGWHTDVFNGDFISYTGDHIDIVAGGNPNVQVSKEQVSILKEMKVFQSFNFISTGLVDNSAGNGSANALPANPAGYYRVKFDGAIKRIPFYN